MERCWVRLNADVQLNADDKPNADEQLKEAHSSRAATCGSAPRSSPIALAAVCAPMAAGLPLCDDVRLNADVQLNADDKPNADEQLKEAHSSRAATCGSAPRSSPIALAAVCAPMAAGLPLCDDVRLNADVQLNADDKPNADEQLKEAHSRAAMCGSALHSSPVGLAAVCTRSERDPRKSQRPNWTAGSTSHFCMQPDTYNSGNTWHSQGTLADFVPVGKRLREAHSSRAAVCGSAPHSSPNALAGVRAPREVDGLSSCDDVRLNADVKLNADAKPNVGKRLRGVCSSRTDLHCALRCLDRETEPPVDGSTMRRLLLHALRRLAVLPQRGAQLGMHPDALERPTDVCLALSVGHTENRGNPSRPGAQPGVGRGGTGAGTDRMNNLRGILFPCSRFACPALVERFAAIKAAKAAGRSTIRAGGGCTAKDCALRWQPMQHAARQLSYAADLLHADRAYLRLPSTIEGRDGMLACSRDVAAAANAAIDAILPIVPLLDVLQPHARVHEQRAPREVDEQQGAAAMAVAPREVEERWRR